MGLNRNIMALKPKTRKLVEIGIEKYVSKYKKAIWINETVRSEEVQSAYYAQGRLTKAEINNLRTKAGLYLLGVDEAQKKVTNTKGTDEFPHKHGIAIDVCPTDDRGSCLWEAPLEEWKKIAECFKEAKIDDGDYIYGLEWGGDWKGFKDNPHFQVYRVNKNTGVKEGWKKILGLEA